MAMGYPTKQIPIYDGEAWFEWNSGRCRVIYIAENGVTEKYKTISMRECDKLEESFGENWDSLDWRVRVFADKTKNGRLKSGKFHIYLSEEKGYALENIGTIESFGDIVELGCHIKNYGDFKTLKVNLSEFERRKPENKGKYYVMVKVSIEKMSVVDFRIYSKEIEEGEVCGLNN